MRADAIFSSVRNLTTNANRLQMKVEVAVSAILFPWCPIYAARWGPAHAWIQPQIPPAITDTDGARTDFEKFMRCQPIQAQKRRTLAASANDGKPSSSPNFLPTEIGSDMISTLQFV